jgi:hypothetical protein
VLQYRYSAELASIPEQARVEQLRQWAKATPEVAQTQAGLARLWKVSQPAVSQALGFLVRRGYAYAMPRDAAGATKYVLAGASRLIFG